MLGGLISGIGSLFGGLANARNQKKAAQYQSDTAYKTAIETTNLQNQANRSLAQYQNEYNTEMWNKQNAYNDPKQQMSRLQNAGLNPALMYTQGSTGVASEPAPAASTNPDYSNYMSASPTKGVFNHPDYGKILGQVIGTYSQLKDLERKDLDNQAVSMQNNYLADSLLARNQLKWQEFYWKGQIPGNDAQEGINKALYDKVISQPDLINSQIKNLDARSAYTRDLLRTNPIQRTLIGLQAAKARNDIFEYEHNDKQWTETLGRWKKPIFGISRALSGLLGKFLK